jgi:hypothetical protein
MNKFDGTRRRYFQAGEGGGRGCTWPGGGMHMARGGMHRGGRGDARASCASPLGTPLIPRKDIARPQSIHVSVSDLYIQTIDLPILLHEIC